MGVVSGAFDFLAHRSLAFWVARMALSDWNRARAAKRGSTDYLLAAGDFAGCLDATKELEIPSWEAIRKTLPAPVAAPTHAQFVLTYLAGYLCGHATVSLVHERAARHLPFWDSSLGGPIRGYTALLATPDAQRILSMPGEQAVQRAHQFACFNGAEYGQPVTNLELEIALFRWLSKRSGVTIPDDVDQVVTKLRSARAQPGHRSAAS